VRARVCVCIFVCMVAAQQCTIAKYVSATSLRIVCFQRTVICPRDRTYLCYIYVSLLSDKTPSYHINSVKKGIIYCSGLHSQKVDNINGDNVS